MYASACMQKTRACCYRSVCEWLCWTRNLGYLSGGKAKQLYHGSLFCYLISPFASSIFNWMRPSAYSSSFIVVLTKKPLILLLRNSSYADMTVGVACACFPVVYATLRAGCEQLWRLRHSFVQLWSYARGGGGDGGGGRSISHSGGGVGDTKVPSVGPTPPGMAPPAAAALASHGDTNSIRRTTSLPPPTKLPPPKQPWCQRSERRPLAPKPLQAAEVASTTEGSTTGRQRRAGLVAAATLWAAGKQEWAKR